MLIYIIIFFIALTCVHYPQLAQHKGFLFCFLLFLALFVGFADMLGGYDRYGYCSLFDGVFNNRIKDIPIYDMAIWGYKSEFGYVWLNYGISFITANRYIFVLIVTLIIYMTMLPSFKDYMDNYPISIILFLALLFFFTFTYLRQVIGVGFAWYAIRFVYRRNLPMFLLFAIIAYSFHNSAAVFFPLYFIPIYKFKRSHILIAMGILFMIGLSSLPGSLFTTFSSEIDDGGRSAQYANVYEMDFFKYEYLVEAAFFMYIIFSNYDLIPNTKKNIVLMNTAIMFCCILVFFVRSDNGGRLGWYYMVGVIATLTTIMDHQDVEPYLRKGLFIVCFLLFSRILHGWGYMLSPYKTFFTNGHSDNDFTFEKFEYDTQYDQDKFYRPTFILFKSKEELQREGW